ncbi:MULTISPECIES: hypothetical protein [Sphingobacterium]|uniref:hypothetical protein n=1 Tax=Sphingobacterium TaxID=28453 RepID=UPI0013DB835F|nr:MULTISPECIES: hypothetical protein [unclassified Sphingobacterium]
MIKKENQHTRFLKILALVDTQTDDAALQANRMLDVLEITRSYLMEFAAYIAVQLQLVEERLLMQQHYEETALDATLKNHFDADQRGFVQQWLHSFEQVVYPSDGECLVKLSSREMLYLVRLIRDAGLLELTELKHTFRFLSRHFYTKQQRRLSAESLRKKYSQLDRPLMVRMEQHLRHLLDINRYYQQRLESSGS